MLIRVMRKDVILIMSDINGRAEQFIRSLERYAPLRAKAAMLRRELRDERSGDAVRLQKLSDELEGVRAELDVIERGCSCFIAPGNMRDESYYENVRNYLRCRYIASMTIEQTAEIMGFSRDTMYRFKRKLERDLCITGKPPRMTF